MSRLRDPTDHDSWLAWASDARNLILLAILLGQMGIALIMFLTRDSQVESLRQNQSKILRILRQDFREECVANDHPVSECEERLREDDRYWPSTSILYRTETLPPSSFMLALYHRERAGD